MNHVEKIVAHTSRQQTPRRLFTVESANRSLVYVRPITEGITAKYAQLVRWRSQRNDLIAERGPVERIEMLGAQIEGVVAKLNELFDELSEVGCELKDWETGLVDFPAEADGRRVLLCWRLGEPNVAYWHEPGSGLIGRQPIEAGFGQPPQE